MRRVGVFGWGVVAPRSPDIASFSENLSKCESWLEPFNGFGPDNFLVGRPQFEFEVYRDWISERFKPNRFSQLQSKMGEPVKFAIGSFIQALGQNPGIEHALQELGPRAHVYVGTGLGDFPLQYDTSLTLYRAQRRWNRFWAGPDRNSALRAFLEGRELAADLRHGAPMPDFGSVPSSPDGAEVGERMEREDQWWRFWAEHCPELRLYLAEQREVESLSVEGDIESGKLSLMKEKQRRSKRLQEKWQAPQPPWECVSANLIWNIDNIAAAQITMLGQLRGMHLAASAACATYGVVLRLAMDAIRTGRADAVVIGTTDASPHPLLVGAFYNARVISANGDVSKPLSQLRGTHVSGGSCVWIVADLEKFRALGFRPLGMEPVATGSSSDADHIITPSPEGPLQCMNLALEAAGADGYGAEIGSWDMHATATPGDFNEVELIRGAVAGDVLLTARKGTFGHGMASCGGWELTAQYLGYERGALFPTPLSPAELNSMIRNLHRDFVFDESVPVPPGLAGKLSMGVGGINSCVLSRPYSRSDDSVAGAGPAVGDP